LWRAGIFLSLFYHTICNREPVFNVQGKPAVVASTVGAPEAGGAEANIGPQAPGNDMPPPAPMQPEKKSLLMQAAAARKGKPEESESSKLLREEQELLRNITSQKALKGVKELAKVC